MFYTVDHGEVAGIRHSAAENMGGAVVGPCALRGRHVRPASRCSDASPGACRSLLAHGMTEGCVGHSAVSPGGAHKRLGLASRAHRPRSAACAECAGPAAWPRDAIALSIAPTPFAARGPSLVSGWWHAPSCAGCRPNCGEHSVGGARRSQRRGQSAPTQSNTCLYDRACRSRAIAASVQFPPAAPHGGPFAPAARRGGADAVARGQVSSIALKSVALRLLRQAVCLS